MSISDTEETYQLFKNTIHSNGHNKGEKEEALVLGKLYYWNETHQYHELVEIFGDEAEEGLQLIHMETDVIINGFNQIKKAKGMFKADCIIEFNKTGRRIKPSIKYKNGGVPSVMNHQRRDQPVFQKGGPLYYLLPNIDTLVCKYHQLRDQGLPEEIMFGELDNFLSQDDKDTLVELVWYFMFRGTGNSSSKQTADSLIIIDKSVKFIKLNGKEDQIEYIKNNWELFNLSLISRKNLKKLKFKDEVQSKCGTDPKYKQKIELMKPWIYETTDNGRNNPENKIKLKMALHIRMK